MKDFSLGDSEYKLMELIWAYAPISSGELSDICEQNHGWKKTTVYTMIKRLCDKGFIANNKAKITFLVRREEVQHQHIAPGQGGEHLVAGILAPGLQDPGGVRRSLFHRC